MESYVVIEIDHDGTRPNIAKIGRKLRKALSLKSGDVIELGFSRPMLFWVTPYNDGWTVKVSNKVASVVRLGKKYMVTLRKVKVSKAIYVELKAHNFVRLNPDIFKDIIYSLLLTPVRESSLVIAESPYLGVIPFKVEKCHPDYSFIVQETKIILG